MQLERKGYDVFLPTYISSRRWSDRSKSLSLPLFPQYVFCRFDIHDRLPILVTPGVNSVVGPGRVPLPVDENEIDAIRHTLQSGIAPQPFPYFSEGTKVRVVSGPLRGLTGIVVTEKNRDHLLLSITILMRAVAVEIDRRCVRILDDGAMPTLSPEKDESGHALRIVGERTAVYNMPRKIWTHRP
jgi:transcription antitermination factor NusG